MFGKFKEFTNAISQTREMQQKAKELDKKLRDKIIEITDSGFTVAVNGKKEILDIIMPENAEKYNKQLIKVLNKAFQKADEAAMGEMKSLIAY